MEQRELLFRQPVFKANGDFKQWHYFKIGERMADYIYVNSHPRPVMQWTGLLDSKGVKIFEGDIVKENAGRSTGVIEWLHGGLVSRNEHDRPMHIGMFLPRDLNALACQNVNFLEVIGNVFATPELLPTPNAEDRS